MAEKKQNEVYKLLNDELPNIAKVVSQMPESVQPKTFDVMLNALLNSMPLQLSSSPVLSSPLPNTQNSNIAEKLPDGEFRFNDIDLKAKNRTDAVRRLIYVAIRIHELIMAQPNVSRKKVINPIMKRWGFIAGSDRVTFSNIVGVHRQGDLYSLDIPAKTKADQIIQEVLDPSIKGEWVMSTQKRSKKKIGEEEK